MSGVGTPSCWNEDVRHTDVVMLAGEDEGLRLILPLSQGIQNRSDLHEIRTRSGDVNMFTNSPLLRIPSLIY